MMTSFFNDNGGVIKRNGQVVDFDSTKIQSAIMKAVVASHTEEELKNFNSSFLASLIVEIEDECKEFLELNPNVKGLHVEKIQDIVERRLIKGGYADTAKEYILYRQKRNEIRNSRDSITKCIQDLLITDAKDNDLKRDNGNIDGNTAMGTMLQIGSSVSKSYYINHMMSKDIAEAYIKGIIHIHDLDFYALTVTCCQIDCLKLFKGGFNTGHGFLREPNSVASYGTHAAIAIQSDQNDCHGGQSIPNFDYSMAPGIYKSFRKAIKENYEKSIIFNPSIDIDPSDIESLIKSSDEDMDKILKGIEIDISCNDHTHYSSYCEYMENIILRLSYKDVEKQTYQAMEGFVHNLNTLHSRAGGQVNKVA